MLHSGIWSNTPPPSSSFQPLASLGSNAYCAKTVVWSLLWWADTRNLTRQVHTNGHQCQQQETARSHGLTGVLLGIEYATLEHMLAVQVHYWCVIPTYFYANGETPQLALLDLSVAATKGRLHIFPEKYNFLYLFWDVIQSSQILWKKFHFSQLFWENVLKIFLNLCQAIPVMSEVDPDLPPTPQEQYVYAAFV